jgi:hypothetical protein
LCAGTHSTFEGYYEGNLCLHNKGRGKVILIRERGA